MTSEERARQRRMSPEEKAEIRRAEKEARDEILAIKRAISAEMNAMTFDEQLAHHAKMAEKYRAEGFNVVSRRSSTTL
jgi:transcription termination factor Rho